MSTNNKTKLGLNQWNGNDIIEYTDHIADNVIIDTEIRNINDTLPDEIFVDGLNGSDVNDGKTSNTAFKTISKAISQLSHIVSTVSGDGLKIKIANGTYDEDVIIKYKSGEAIDLIGNTSSKTAVKVRSIRFEGYVGRRISADCIEATTNSMDAFVAINCLNYSFTNCTVQTTTQVYDGFSVAAGSGAIVNCVASNRASAIVCKTAGIMTISQNSGSNNVVGVQAFNGAIITYDGTTPGGTTKLLQNGGTITNLTRNVVVGTSSQLVFYVDGTNGNDANDGKSVETALKTIKKAIELASIAKYVAHAVKIRVMAGDYSSEGQLVVDGLIGTAYGYFTITAFDGTNDVSSNTSAINYKIHSFIISGCKCNVYVQSLCSLTTTTHSFQALDTIGAYFNYCYTDVTSSYAGFRFAYSVGRVLVCKASGKLQALLVDTNSSVQSRDWGSTTDNTYGIYNISSTVYKYGTQPTGTTVEYKINGGKIWGDSMTTDATDTSAGIVELATSAEALAGTSSTTVITPSTLKSVFSDYGAVQSASASYTLSLGNANKVVVMGGASTQTITIPTNASVAFPIGTQITFISASAGSVTFAPSSGVSLYSKDTKRTIDGQFASATLIKTATDTWSLIGALKA